MQTSPNKATGAPYAFARENIGATHEAVRASGDSMVVAVLDRSCQDEVIAAIESTLKARDWDARALTLVTVDNPNDPLDPKLLFEVLEGLDPLVVVACGPAACALLDGAYPQSGMPTTGSDAWFGRVFGRDACVIPSFGTLLQSDEGKKRAWKALRHIKPPPGQHA